MKSQLQTRTRQMWTGRTTRCILVAALVLTAGLARPALAQDKVPAERRLPKKTLAFLSLRSATEFKKKWAESLLGKMIADPAVAEFRAEVEGKIKEHGAQVKEHIGLSLEDLALIPQGDFTVAFLVVRAKPSAVVMLDFGEGKELVLKLLEKASEELTGHGAKRTEQEIEGDEVVVFSFGGDEEGAARNQPFKSVAWCIKGTSLVVGSSLETVKLVLGLWDGKGEETLAENETYRYIAQRCRDEHSEPLATWFVDPIGIVNVGASQFGGAATIAIGGAIPLLGLSGFKGAGGSFDMATEEFDVVSRTLVYMNQPPQGALNFFQFPPIDQTPPKWVSRDAVTYSTLNWDVEKAWKAVEGIYNQINALTGGKEKFADFIDKQAQNQETGNLHYKKDLVDQLTGKLHYLTHESTDPSVPRILGAIELKDPAAFEKVLAKLTGHPGFPGKARDFRGSKLWELEAGPLKIGIAIAQRCLMITSDVTMLEGVIRGSDEPLTETADYQRVAKKFPSETGSLSFQRKDQFKMTYETLKTAIQSAGDMSIDFTKLPKTEVLEKFLAPSGSYMVNDAKGLFWLSYTLKNE